MLRSKQRTKVQIFGTVSYHNMYVTQPLKGYCNKAFPT